MFAAFHRLFRAFWVDDWVGTVGTHFFIQQQQHLTCFLFLLLSFFFFLSATCYVVDVFKFFFRSGDRSRGGRRRSVASHETGEHWRTCVWLDWLVLYITLQSFPGTANRQTRIEEKILDIYIHKISRHCALMMFFFFVASQFPFFLKMKNKNKKRRVFSRWLATPNFPMGPCARPSPR